MTYMICQEVIEESLAGIPNYGETCTCFYCICLVTSTLLPRLFYSSCYEPLTQVSTRQTRSFWKIAEMVGRVKFDISYLSLYTIIMQVLVDFLADFNDPQHDQTFLDNS